MKRKILHGDADQGILHRKSRRSKHADLINQCLDMQPGDFLEIPIPPKRSMVDEQRRITRVLDRYVRKELPEYLYRVRLTERRRVRVSCHARPLRGRLARRAR